MTGTQLTCSVVICAYTEARWEALTAAVRSVREQSTSPLDIIVVIDHNQRLLERARVQFTGAIVVENYQERGLSGARNSGIAEAQGDIIAFLDDDAVAAPDWLEHILAGYEDLNVVGVGGKIEPIWQEGKPGWFPEEFGWVVGCTYRGMPESVAPVRNLIGANMSFRRAVFAEAGGFRSGIGRVGTLPVGCEETELCIRVHQRWPQADIRYAPQARVAHLVPSGRATWRYFRSRCYAEGISKALVSQLVGTNDGLASERAYTLRTLPQGVGQNLADAVMRYNFDAARRAGAIVLGLAVTSIGYLVGRIGCILRSSDTSITIQSSGNPQSSIT